MFSLRATKSKDVSAWSSNDCVSKVSRLTTSKPLAQPTHSLDFKKWIEDDSVGI